MKDEFEDNYDYDSDPDFNSELEEPDFFDFDYPLPRKKSPDENTSSDGLIPI